MSSKKKILVFPCGSEIGLEIHRSMRFASQFELIGASSVDDHGRFVYEKYIPGLSFANHPGFISSIKKIVGTHGIDAVYPTMDSVIHVLKKHEDEIGCRVIAPPERTTGICLSKKKTYDALRDVVRTPKLYSTIEEVDRYPVFLKPDIGYGSRGAGKADNKSDLLACLNMLPDRLVLEYLTGDEYTVDCLSDKDGKLCFAGARQRRRIINGISVSTSTECPSHGFWEMARNINDALAFQGAWFFQVKMNKDGDPVLLEVASRFAGSSSVYRVQGINFALLSVYSAFGQPVDIMPNHYEVELDRALNVYCRATIDFESVYVDYETTHVLGNKVNSPLMRFLFDCLNKNKRLILFTRSASGSPGSEINPRVSGVFHEMIHLKERDHKSDFITQRRAILIDDSFAERKQVKQSSGIPVFSSDMVADLMI